MTRLRARCAGGGRIHEATPGGHWKIMTILGAMSLNGILAAISVGFRGYLILNRMPRLYEPIDEAVAIRRASRDLWCVAVHTGRTDEARDILQACGAQSVEVLPG